ncbi:hypothetical protein [Hyphomicrobium sp. 99]|uniref:hypothetical protein n=1 Tax=Hyphomicrobium sp. 99 TaxID=1163419 RepID=UPI0005F81592|nr:hypothetical protein [Hyphomicrobium sp. 99]
MPGLIQKRGLIGVSIVVLGIAQFGSPAYADWEPESIRIQKEAEKSYRTAPVVPIDRPNSHHRDYLKDGPAGNQLGPSPIPGSTLPGAGKRASDH